MRGEEKNDFSARNACVFPVTGQFPSTGVNQELNEFYAATQMTNVSLSPL